MLAAVEHWVEAGIGPVGRIACYFAGADATAAATQKRDD